MSYGIDLSMSYEHFAKRVCSHLRMGSSAPKTAFNGFGWGRASGLLGRKHKEGVAFFERH